MLGITTRPGRSAEHAARGLRTRLPPGPLPRPKVGAAAAVRAAGAWGGWGLSRRGAVRAPRRDRNPKGTAVVPAPSFTKGRGSPERGRCSPACGGVSEASPPHAPRAGFVTPPARNLSCSPARLCGVRGEAGAGGPRGDHAVRVWRWGRAGRGPRCSPRRGQESHPKPRRARKRPPGPSVSSSCALTRSDHPGQVGLWAGASPSVSFRS